MCAYIDSSSTSKYLNEGINHYPILSCTISTINYLNEAIFCHPNSFGRPSFFDFSGPVQPGYKLNIDTTDSFQCQGFLAVTGFQSRRKINRCADAQLDEDEKKEYRTNISFSPGENENHLQK